MLKIMNISGANYEPLMSLCSKTTDHKVYINHILMFNKVSLIIRGTLRFTVTPFIPKT